MEFVSKYHATSEALQDEWVEIQAAQANPARFEVLYDRYYERILSFIYQRLDDKDLAFDTTSQVFLKAMQNLHKFQFKGVPFASWLFRIAKNEVYQLFRDQKAERTVNIEKVSLKNMVDDMEEDFYEPYYEVLKASVADLEEEEIQFIEMRFFEKRAFKEIGEIMHITENHAKVKLYRILDKLKKALLKKKKSH
ncbi:MAG TPA: sigma-70 family RNA polymerase sigma factor [Bacteroidia bacterium]|nr:sigma-70 family RNA polymerase sigma factor [Bacteroidia bacterium]